MAGEQILVVEDQRAAAGALKMRLRGLGYDVVAIARDGAEAIEKASELQPALILMDIRLGEGMDGIEAARRIRIKSNIPLVYLSAHADQKLLARARATRPAGFINKPFTTKDLLTAIDFALNGNPITAGAIVVPIPEERPQPDDTDGLVTTDGEGRISFANRAAERLIGVSRRQLIDRPIAELLAKLYDAGEGEATRWVHKAMQGDGEQSLRRSVSRGDTSRQQLDLLTPLFDARGQSYGVALRLVTHARARVERRVGNGLEAALVQALDATPNGVLSVNAELRIEHLNRSAREILARNRGLEIRNGALFLLDKLLDQRLREFVRVAIQRGREQTSAATGAMFVRAPMSGEHVELIVAPVPSQTLAEQQARVVIYLFDANSPRNVSHDLLTGLYGLTQTEAKLVQLMSNGMTLDEVGQELEISVNTVRTHLKHVFHKTGLNRQTELIQRIGCGPASLLVGLSPPPRH
ncbi:MAG: response regulator [Gammaproteobacteria bacterium]|nr:response regulator [Gammaproteobacteria bacterium]